MAHQLFQLPKPVNISSNLTLLAGAKALFQLTGSTTNTPVYQDSALTTPHANPVIADSAGVFAPIYLDPSIVYKVTIKTSADVTLYTSDPVNDQLLSQAIIGGYLYPRTSAEISAGVTPVNYAYAPLDIRRLGADATGIADSLAAITNTLLVARAMRSSLGVTSVTVDIPDGKYKVTAGIPLVSGIVLRCRSRWSATIVCTGSTAALYTATLSGTTFSDNLSANQSQIQAGTHSTENAGVVNLLFDHTGAISGTAGSGAAWESVVQINGAPHIVLDSIFAASVTNNINGISVSLSWRARIQRTWTPRQNTYTGGTGLLVDSESNSAYIEAPFSFGAWAFGIDAGANSITIMEPNVEFATVGVRLSGVRPRLYGGYYEGNGTDIRLGIAGSPVNGAIVERPWCNGSSSTYSIDILAATDSEVVEPFFTGTYSTTKFKTTAASTENYGNRVRIHAADANNPGLAGLGLIGGRNLIEVQGEDADDHRFFALYNSSDGSRAEMVLNQRGAQFVCFELWIQNDGGTLKVAITDGDETATTYDGCFAALSATLIAQSDVSSGAGFGANVPASRLSGTNSCLILNTNDNVLGEQSFIGGNIFTNNGTALSAIVRLKSRDINGTTRARPEVLLRNAATGAAFDFDTTNFTAGEYAHIPIIGFIK